MTICVSVQVAEGLIFAADSAVTLSGLLQGQSTPQVLQIFESANKVTQFGDYPIGVMSWGMGAIHNRTVQSLIMEHEYAYPKQKDVPDFQVRKIAEDLVAFIRARYDAAFTDPANRPAMGLAIGGHSHDQFFAEQYKCEFPGTDFLAVRQNLANGFPSFGANWFGMPDALTRLICGYDPGSLTELINRGVDKAIVDKWVADGIGQIPIVFDGMPLKDAIDFADYCARVTIGRWRFAVGPNLCGGEVDIAVMRPRSFQWAQRKRWSIKRYEED
ncbi:MAG: hypothetical protein ABSD59_09150 [Terracidiphilus sp.]